MKMTIKLIITLLLIICFKLNIQAQDFENSAPARYQVHQTDISTLTELEILEDSLVFFADSMYNSPVAENRIEGNDRFIQVMKRFLRANNSYNFPCKKLSTKITLLSSPDNAFKLYNWEIMQANDAGRYYGVIQLADGNIVPMVDISDKVLRGGEDSVFTDTRWYGCLYYNIIPQDIGGQKVYFLLGWNGNSINSERKVIEPFGFNSRGKAIFGAPMFNIIDRGKRKSANRFMIEYQKGARVSMNFDKETDMIILDHCESQIGDPAKKYTYIPDGTYDGLKWDGMKWNMSENVIQIQDLQQGNAPADKPIK
jgi:hypothetical protein